MNNKILCLFLGICSIAFAQKTKVEVATDTTNIRIGEQFTYKILVHETKNVIIPKLDNLHGLEVVDTLKIDTLTNKLVQKYVLTGFDSGAFYIPKQQIFIKNQAYITDSLLVTVATVPVDTTKVAMHPIKGIKKEPYQFDDFKNYIYWSIAIILLVTAMLYYFLYFRKKKEVVEEIKEPLLPPYEEAKEKLEELDKQQLWQNNQTKKYYSELTNIVRNYIERELQIPALESTTNELIAVLQDFDTIEKITVPKDIIVKLKELLQEADLVKFAKSKPLDYEIQQNRKDAELVIDSLKPKQETIEDDAVE